MFLKRIVYSGNKGYALETIKKEANEESRIYFQFWPMNNRNREHT